MRSVWHALTCTARSHWRLHRYWQPFWVHDATAKMLGINHVGCPRCGRGAIEAIR